MITKQKTWQQPSTDHMLETSVKIEDIELRTVYLKKQFFFFVVLKRKKQCCGMTLTAITSKPVSIQQKQAY